MKKIVAAFIITVISAAQTFAGGIIFYTSGGSPYVNVVQYETYTAPSAHLSYITVKGGQKTQIQSAGIIANIPLPTTGTEYSLEDIQTNIAQANAMASRQPKYAQAMQKVSQLWTDQIPAAEALQKRRLAEEAAAKKKAEENNRLAVENAEKKRIAKEADDKRLAADAEKNRKKAAENELKSEKNKNEWNAKLAALSEKAQEIRCIIRRKLDPENFKNLLWRFTGDYYEIELDGELAILATTNTKFTSGGVASVYVGASCEKQVKTNDGFEKAVKIYIESNPADVKRLLDCIDKGPEPVVESNPPLVSNGNSPVQSGHDAPSKNGDDPKSIQELLSAAENNDPSAQFALAIRYATGNGLPKNPRESWKLALKAAENGNPEAQYAVGKIYLVGTPDVLMDINEARQWLQKSANQGYKDAELKLAELAKLNGSETAEVREIRKAAEAGNSDAQYKLSQMYFFGKGVEGNKVEFEKWLRKSAQGGNITAKVMLDALEKSNRSSSNKSSNDTADSKSKSNDLSQGKDFTVEFGNDTITFHADGAITSTGTSDLKISRGKLINDPIDLLRSKAEEKDAEALYELGIRYLTGSGIEENRKNAIETLLKASLEGQQDAKKLCMYIGKH